MRFFFRLRLAVLLAPALLAGAPPALSQQPTANRTLEPPVELQNLGLLKNALVQYHDRTGSNGCYAKDIEAQTERAQAALAARLRQPRRPGERLGIVFDIDETVLSNWPELAKLQFGFYQSLENEWEHSERAEAIPGSLALYKQAVASGLAVFFITGRPEAMRDVTAGNLRAQGMMEWTKLVLRAQDEQQETAVVYKSSERQKIVAEGYTLVMSIGDQWSDLDGEPHAEISIKLPNPFYFIP